MTVTKIYGGVPSESLEVSESFSNGKLIYITAPDITDEIEIDLYLQYQVNGFDNKLIQLNAEFRALSILVYTIPVQFQDENDIYIAFSSSLNTTIEIWVVAEDASNQVLLEKLNQILQKVDSIEELETFDTITDLLQFTAQALIAISTGSPLPLLPNTIPNLPSLPSNINNQFLLNGF